MVIDAICCIATKTYLCDTGKHFYHLLKKLVMRTIKHIALGIFLTLSVFAAVLYTSCTKSGCKGVTCLNGGVCSGGICGSCPSGVGGSNCQTVYRNLYDSVYIGSVTYNTSNIDSVDSAYVIRTDTSNVLTFSIGNDSFYTQMNMTWNRPGRSGGSTTITLFDFTPTGASFSVAPFQVDTFTCTGSGSINSNTVSLNLTATPPNSAAQIITFNNFRVQ